MSKHIRLWCRRVRLTRGGYEVGAPLCYFGVGAPLYRVTDEYGDLVGEYRAVSRKEALAQARADIDAGRA